jgi:hypothetical protein
VQQREPQEQAVAQRRVKRFRTRQSKRLVLLDIPTTTKDTGPIIEITLLGKQMLHAKKGVTQMLLAKP